MKEDDGMNHKDPEPLTREAAGTLSATSPATPGRAWQTMDTAPTDARLLLLCGPEGVRIGHRFDREDWEGVDGGLLSPTHWMPVPAPPAPPAVSTDFVSQAYYQRLYAPKKDPG
jgi:hypothetical protein